MSWTDGADLATGTLVTGTIWNNYNGAAGSLMVVKSHAHGGATGEGSQSLGPLVLEDFTDAAAPAAPGAGKTRIYTVSGVPHFRAGAAGADTALVQDPTTTRGDLIARNNSGVLVRLAVGASTQFLGGGADPAWADDPVLIGSNYHRFRYEPINVGGVNVVNVGSGTTALLAAGRGQLMSTGATNPSSTSQRVGLVGSGTVLSLVSKIRRLEFTAYISDVLANANAYLYMTDESVDTAPSATARHLGIKNLNGVVSFTTADGTTEQTTDVSAFVSAATETAFVITFDGTTAKLYINGTLRATHATNVPAGGTLQTQFRAFINNNSTTNARALSFYSVDALYANS